MRRVLFWFLVLLDTFGSVFLLLPLMLAGAAHGAPLPGDAAELLPLLTAEINTYWPELQPRAFPPAVVEQESLWKLHAQLKTARERGCGLGQFTVAYDSAGRVRFDALAETRRLDPSLAGWSWRDCYAAKYQLRAVVLKLRVNDRHCATFMHGNDQVKACGAAEYNGGAGSMVKRIRSCRADPGCVPSIWFDNLERQCPQARTKAAGYGESFCEINSRYPGRVFARMPKYQGLM